MNALGIIMRTTLGGITIRIMRTGEGAIKVLGEETNKPQILSSTIETPVQPTGLQNLVCFAAVPVDGDSLQPIFPNGPVHLRNGFHSGLFGQVYGFERFSGSWGISTISPLISGQYIAWSNPNALGVSFMLSEMGSDSSPVYKMTF